MSGGNGQWSMRLRIQRCLLMFPLQQRGSQRFGMSGAVQGHAGVYAAVPRALPPGGWRQRQARTDAREWDKLHIWRTKGQWDNRARCKELTLKRIGDRILNIIVSPKKSYCDSTLNYFNRTLCSNTDTCKLPFPSHSPYWLEYCMSCSGPVTGVFNQSEWSAYSH